MRRICRRLIICRMTLEAIRVGQLKIIGNVTQCARCCYVFSGQRKIRQRMIEFRACPGCRRMTRFAVTTEIFRDMVRIGRSRVVRRTCRTMALIATQGQRTARKNELIVVIHMARRARCRDVCSGQRQPRR